MSSDNDLIKILGKHIPNLPEKSGKVALGIAMSLISVAAVDKKILQEEVEYSLRELRRNTDFEKDELNILFDFTLHFIKKNGVKAEILNSLLSTVAESLDTEAKRYFISSLFIISRSDLNMSLKEEHLISHIAKRVGVNEDITTYLKSMEKVILDERLGNSSDEYQIVHGADKFEGL